MHFLCMFMHTHVLFVYFYAYKYIFCVFVYALTEKNFVYGIEDLNILLGNFEGNHERLRKISKLEFSKIIGI